MTTGDAYDVVVIGLGPAGATAARTLADRGLCVLAVDKSSFPRDKVCGGCLSAHAVSMLAEQGLRPEDIAGVRIDKFALWSGGRESTFPLGGGIAVSRNRLDALLALRAEGAGVTVHFGVTAEDPVREGDRWTVSLRNGSHLTRVNARALVVCEGLGARFLSRVAGFKMRRAPASHIGVGALIESAGAVEAGTITMLLGRGGYLGLTVVENGRVNAAAAISPRLARSKGSMAKAVQHIVETSGFEGSLDLSKAKWRGTPPLTTRTRPVARNGIFVIGDAASYVEPFTGEGMTWAIDAGRQVSEFVEALVRNEDASTCAKWDRTYRRNFATVQKRCRLVARTLRLPTASSVVATMLKSAPTVSRPIVRYIHGANW